jgi:FdhE protein
MSNSQKEPLHQVKTAAEAIKKVRPFYAALIDFYKDVFLLQEQARQTLQIQSVVPEAKLRAVKAQEGFPLIAIDQFQVDYIQASQLFIQFCDLAQNVGDNLAAPSKAVSQALAAERFTVNALVDDLLHAKEEAFNAVAQMTGADVSLLLFLTYNSIKPAILENRVQLVSCLEDAESWSQGYCPICGNPPGLSLFKDEGHRCLSCSFCFHQWSAPRLFCPYCNNRNSHKLSYFYSEDEPAYRVDVCEKCKKFIKNVDLREMARPFYAPLEQVTTLHLDLKAAELGYESELSATSGAV